MAKVVEVILQWDYSPKDFLKEEDVTYKGGIDLEIGDGKMRATIEIETFEKSEDIQNELTQFIENRMYAVLLEKNVSFELGKPSRTDLSEDGILTSYAGKITLTQTTSSSMDVRVIRDGRIVADTKQEREDKQKWRIKAIETHRLTNDALDLMLHSYAMALKHSKYELVHLYEVRDALARKFNDKKRKTHACTTLGIDKDNWDKFGSIANCCHIRHSRHVGKSVSSPRDSASSIKSLRDAKPCELSFVRRFVLRCIDNYLTYLDNQHQLEEQP